MTEYNSADLFVRARELSTEHAASIGVKQMASKGPHWFLAVHSAGAQLRVAWTAENGDIYSTACELGAVGDPNGWLENAKEAR